MPRQQEDLRFLEEHVMAMAAAHRLVFASIGRMDVDLTDLICEVTEGLRVIAGLPAVQLIVLVPNIACPIGLDQAVGIALYLAVTLPPYLDHAAATASRVTLGIATSPITIKICPQISAGTKLETLRQRLMTAYVHRLGATATITAEDGSTILQLAMLSR